MSTVVQDFRPSRLPRISLEAKLLFAIATLDLASTVLLIVTDRAVEANPLMAYFLQFGIVPFCIAKLCFVIPPIALAEWYRRYNDWLMRTTLRWVTVAYVAIYVVGVVHHNTGLL